MVCVDDERFGAKFEGADVLQWSDGDVWRRVGAFSREVLPPPAARRDAASADPAVAESGPSRASGAAPAGLAQVGGGAGVGARRASEAQPGASPGAGGPDAPAAPVFGVGEKVHYWSQTHGRWLITEVLGCPSAGLYHLRCRKSVPAAQVFPVDVARLRDALSQMGPGSSAASPGPTGAAGESAKKEFRKAREGRQLAAGASSHDGKGKKGKKGEQGEG